MNHGHEEFCPAKFVRGLPEPHLEVLSEFAEEAEVNLLALSRSLKFHKEPTAREFLTIFSSAPAELVAKRQARAPRNTPQEWSQELGLEVSPAEKKGGRLPAVLTHEEVRSMLETSKDSRRNHLIIRVLYATGLRRAELTKFNVADVDFAQNRIFVRSGKEWASYCTSSFSG